ncbi:hypothetical protein ACF09Y_12080 [Streptomyces massasporeus]|nr:hypothetical protein [Streptomyces sp. WAC04114]
MENDDASSLTPARRFVGGIGENLKGEVPRPARSEFIGTSPDM